MAEIHESKVTPGRFYGWTPSPPDFRDVMYMPSTALRAALPSSVQLNVPPLREPFNPAWQQGRIGSCGPHSSAKDIVFAGINQDSISQGKMPSRLFIYYVTRTVMGTVGQDSGVQNRAMMQALTQFGWCDEELWPYSDDQKFKQRPPQACYEQAAKRKITAFLRVERDLMTMKTCLADGDPFIFGFSVYESMESPMVEKTGRVPMPTTRERQVGGHDVLMIGYRDDIQCFIFANSWGPEWGDNGIGYIPYSYATHPQLADDFWTVRHSAYEPDQPPPPLPPPTPTPPGPGGLDLLGLEFHAPPRLTDKLSITW